MDHFHYYTDENIQQWVNKRPSEVKLGENVLTGFEGKRYVIIGIPESIGVKANFGVDGTETLWPAFLASFLNIQSTDKLKGDEISILGHFDFKGLLEGQHLPVDKYRSAVEIIDQEVKHIIREIISRRKIPIIIGGGHNNCYPILAGANEGLIQTEKITTKGIHAINMDAHSDFRPKEGRHSGNGFRYAIDEGYLKKYAIIGLHENYNSQSIIDEMSHKAAIIFSFWEDIFLRELISYPQSLQQAISFTQGNYTGIELDLDSIEGVLSSAITPSGITATSARQYLYQTGSLCQVAYVHICEGATELENGVRDTKTGKLVSYLVSDFIKANTTF
jgi:formiminoglutamase